MTVLAATLDCEYYSSSITCLADAYAANISDVEAFLSALDIEEEYRTRDVSVLGDSYLVERFQSQFGKPVQVWSSICWFHLTRVPANSDFAEGILPLGLALEKIWKTLISEQIDVCKRGILGKLQKTGVPDRQYNLKAGVALHDGPYAMLVKESAFHPAVMGNHDYLLMPEIIEDICNGYKQCTGESIFDEVANSLKPCIVKFVDYDTAPELDYQDRLRQRRGVWRHSLASWVSGRLHAGRRDGSNGLVQHAARPFIRDPNHVREFRPGGVRQWRRARLSQRRNLRGLWFDNLPA